MLLHCLHQRLEQVLIEEYYSIKVKLGAEEIEEDVLTVTFVHLGRHVGELVEHGERLRCVGHARYHLSHTLLQLHYFIL